MTPWCAIWNSIMTTLTFRSLGLVSLKLWLIFGFLSLSQSWNTELISEIFDDPATQIITQTQTVPSDQTHICQMETGPKKVSTPPKKPSNFLALLCRFNSFNMAPEAYPNKPCLS
jgi:hypothetical protein